MQFLAIVLLMTLSVVAQAPSPVKACAACIRAHEEFLASDALNGRGSGTRDELIAANYIASQLRQYGVAPGAPDGSYIQRVVQNGQARAETAYSPALPAHLETCNVLGILHGSDPRLRRQVLLLSAHMDHLGVWKPLNGDAIYNGADDDASGVSAVLELARTLGRGRHPRRTILFAFYGAEEFGGIGSNYFADHPSVPLTDLVANLEFEMIGRPDAAMPPHTLWLTGFERSDLGPELQRRGARLGADPHLAQDFVRRSDSYSLAKRGIVAHIISSFGLHAQYHKPDDDVAHPDFAHMTEAIEALLRPVRWLADSDFVPHWLPGKKP